MGAPIAPCIDAQEATGTPHARHGHQQGRYPIHRNRLPGFDLQLDRITAIAAVNTIAMTPAIVTLRPIVTQAAENTVDDCCDDFPGSDPGTKTCNEPSSFLRNKR